MYTLQLHGERQVYPLPPGLTELMSDISREVLRQQPAKLYEYIANYLDTLVRLRAAAQTGEALITDMLGETKERLGMVAALGVTWEEADRAARRIQAGYRGYRLRRQLREKQRVLQSPSFQEYLQNLTVEGDETSQGSSLVEEAYYKYMKGEHRRDVEEAHSTHTIEGFTPKGSEKFPKRDSKIQVFEQTPRQSIASTWSDMINDKSKESKIDTQLLYEQTPAAELANPRLLSEIPATSETPSVSQQPSSPSHYDDAQPGMCMLDETGQLVKEDDKDIVTLYSADSVYNMSKKMVSFVKLPSVTSVEPRTDAAREIIDIIESRSSRVSKFIHSLDSLDEVVKLRVEDSVKQDLYKMSAAARGSTAHSIDSRSGVTKSKSGSRRKHSDVRLSSKSKSSYKAKELTGENGDKSSVH